MFRSIFKILVSLIFIQLFGCSLPYQLRSYTDYYLQDLKVENGNIIVLICKEEYRQELSISSAMMNEMSTRTSYDILSYNLLSFKIIDFEKSKSILDLKNKKNIISKKNIKHISPFVPQKIINWNKVIFSYDIFNNKPCISMLILDDNYNSIHITCEKEIKKAELSFDREVFFYIQNNQVYTYSINEETSRELVSDVDADNFFRKFDNTSFIANKGRWFFDRIGEDLNKLSYKYELVDKKNNTVLSTFFSQFRNFQDFRIDKKDSRLLVFSPSIGLEILDLNGNSLYSLHEDFLKRISRAVFHKDKVYAAGITTKEGPLGKKDYIEIIQWDYKNDSVIKKYYPCDSPELEM